jgi:hypothetical protein
MYMLIQMLTVSVTSRHCPFLQYEIEINKLFTSKQSSLSKLFSDKTQTKKTFTKEEMSASGDFVCNAYKLRVSSCR